MRAGLAVIALTSAAHADTERVVYVEALGKGGAYGVGFEEPITPALALGITASFVELRDEQIATFAPYVHGILAQRGAHALVAQVGATIVRTHVPSPVGSWDGATDIGAGGFASLGYEHRWSKIIARAALSVVAGEGGVAPWGGLAIGVAP